MRYCSNVYLTTIDEWCRALQLPFVSCRLLVSLRGAGNYTNKILDCGKQTKLLWERRKSSGWLTDGFNSSVHIVAGEEIFLSTIFAEKILNVSNVVRVHAVFLTVALTSGSSRVVKSCWQLKLEKNWRLIWKICPITEQGWRSQPVFIQHPLSVGQEVSLKCNWNSQLITNRRFVVQNINGQQIGVKKAFR